MSLQNNANYMGRKAKLNKNEIIGSTSKIYVKRYGNARHASKKLLYL